MKKKVVLAYSGGLDTSCIVHWLRERDYEVICFMADLGQQEDMKVLKRRAFQAGASKVFIGDLKNEFIHEFIYPAIRAGAVYEDRYLLATALGRPLIAKSLVELARKEKAGFVAHGCTGKGNDQVRIELTVNILAPELKIIAPVRDWEFRSRDEEIEYLRKNKIPIEITKKKPYSLDKNLWGVSIECGVLEDPYTEPPESAFQISRAPEKAPDRPEYVEIDFKEGIPVRLNGKQFKPQGLIERLNEIGGRHGVGRSDMVENRLVGIKSREIYEAPAGWMVHIAHRELEALVLDRQTSDFKRGIAVEYGKLIYNGLWYSPLKGALDAFINTTQQRVTGKVRLKLFKGKCACVGRKSLNSLYRKELATYTEEDEFDQKMAEGFIRITGMPYLRKE